MGFDLHCADKIPFPEAMELKTLEVIRTKTDGGSFDVKPGGSCPADEEKEKEEHCEARIVTTCYHAETLLQKRS